MDMQNLFRPGAQVYFVGIKGTGVCALAELMHNSGMRVSGSDIGEVFYTDAILQERGIPYYETVDASHIRDDFDIVIHSAAYGAENPELAEAARRSIPVFKYPEALGAWSAGFDSAGIAGVHGKTTTTAIAGELVKALDLPAQILVGSAVSGFKGRSTLILGNKYFIAETCEYRKHFMAFHPRRIVLTAVESDHQDFFPDYNSIRDAFVEYCRLLPSGGRLIYCADDPGAGEVAEILRKENSSLEFIPYGFNADGEYRIENYHVKNERAFFSFAAFPLELAMRVPGRHQAYNAAAALALCSSLLADNGGAWNGQRFASIKKALLEFRGSKRRSEILGEEKGVLFMDDYGHHPTAIRSTLEGLKAFYPQRRIVLSFMSHTYTRTSALLDEFASCFEQADILFLHKIYSSAREQYRGGINGKTLYEKIKNNSGFTDSQSLYYIDEPMDSFEQIKEILREGDLFITMGAGSNWPLGLALYNYFRGKR
jgi:UDP-N-acetylmuramate--alanine ligase